MGTYNALNFKIIPAYFVTLNLSGFKVTLKAELALSNKKIFKIPRGFCSTLSPYIKYRTIYNRSQIMKQPQIYLTKFTILNMLILHQI